MIGLYCPSVPPEPGGVADHTLMLAQLLHRMGTEVAVLARRGNPVLFAPIPCRVGLAPEEIAGAAQDLGVSVVLVQYVPFLWSHRGVSPALVRGIWRIHKAGLRLATYVHEPAVPFTRPTWLVTGIPQRLQLAMLLRYSERAYAPVPDFIRRMRRWAPRSLPMAVTPVGATLPVSTLSRAEARKRLGLVEDQVAIGIFSPGASGFAHEYIARAALRLAGEGAVRWIRFGHGSGRPLPGYPTGPTVITLGEQSREEVADTMRALDIAAAPYVDGLTLRRSSAMLPLATGIATVSSEGHLFDPAMRALALCEPDPDAFAECLATLVRDPSARVEAAARTASYAELASMEKLARILIRDLA